jgi:hypothetical protein
VGRVLAPDSKYRLVICLNLQPGFGHVIGLREARVHLGNITGLSIPTSPTNLVIYEMINSSDASPFSGSLTLKLSFLGQSYEASTPPIEATKTSETAAFLGQPYARKQFAVALRQSTEELTYRGVRYTA